MSIRWKLLGSYLLVSSLAIALLALGVLAEIRQRYLQSLESALRAQSATLAESLGDKLGCESDSAGLANQVAVLSRAAGARLTIIAPDGRVLADSDHDPATMDNHLHRPEVRQAIELGSGTSVRHSETLRVEMLYAAAAVKGEHGEVLGVVRLAVPLRGVEHALARFRSSVAAGAVAALLLSVLLSAMLTQNLARRVASLVQVAKKLASGDLEARCRVRGGELGALAATLNAMAAQLSHHVAELRAEKGRADATIDSLGDAVLVTDQSGRVVRLNAAATRLFQVDASEAIGMPVIYATRNHELGEACQRALKMGEATRQELTLHLPQERQILVSITPVAAEATLGVVAVLHDVTELRRLEAVRREFVANASHELQTPITAIKAMAETMASAGPEDRETIGRFLPELEAQADRLAALVRDMLELSSAEAAAVPREPVAIELRRLVDEVVSEHLPLARQRGVSLAVDVPANLSVTADHAALVRILSNLLDNAIKYTEAGGRAGVSARAAEGAISISVWDTGVGIPQAEQSRIFERFYRADKARSRALGGTGLGLAIVKHLVESLGGQVRVASELGKGSTFTVTLPGRTSPLASPSS